MKEETLINLLSLAAAALCLTGLGLLLANMFFETQTNLLPYALGCIVLANLMTLLRNLRQRKK